MKGSHSFIKNAVLSFSIVIFGLPPQVFRLLANEIRLPLRLNGLIASLLGLLSHDLAAVRQLLPRKLQFRALGLQFLGLD